MPEMGTSNTASAGRRRLAYVLVGAAAAALALLIALAPQAAEAQKAKQPLPKLLVLGASAQTAQPACPASPCQAIGKVTGFQNQIGNAKGVFVAPFDGKIVAWSLKLSAPTDTQKKFFNDFYGGDPSARLSILKPLKKSPGVYKLKSQTPIEELSGVLGTTTTFTLKAPLTIRSGQIAALTVPTWAPVFAIGLAKNNTWLASRKAGSCNDPDAIKAGSAQQTPGTQRKYGCGYNTARLLYSATMVRGTV